MKLLSPQNKWGPSPSPESNTARMQSLPDSSVLQETAEETAVAPLRAPVTRSDATHHVAALNGFRGAAILMVLFCHTALLLNFTRAGNAIHDAYMRFMLGGWCGVDLFFVLSGFLITGILVKTRSTPRYFYNFYGRRVVRIFPLYYAFIFVMAVLVPLRQRLVGTTHVESLGAGYWLYLQNFMIAGRGAWANGMTDVTWSLAIEEQFYLLWPLLIWLLDRRTMMWLCGAIVIASPVLRAVLLHHGVHPLAIYVMTPTRIDGLATGAWVALFLYGRALTSRLRGIATIAALVGILGVAVLAIVEHQFGDTSPLTEIAGYSCLNLLFGSTVILLLSPRGESILSRVFSLPPLRFFGRYSYGLYLLHLPVLAALRQGVFLKLEHHALPLKFPTITLLGFQLVVIAGSVAAALVSWNVLEKRCLQLKRYFAAVG